MPITPTRRKNSRRTSPGFFQALRQGVVKVETPTRYDLANAADAHRDLESRRTTGALVLLP